MADDRITQNDVLATIQRVYGADDESLVQDFKAFETVVLRGRSLTQYRASELPQKMTTVSSWLHKNIDNVKWGGNNATGVRKVYMWNTRVGGLEVLDLFPSGKIQGTGAHVTQCRAYEACVGKFVKRARGEKFDKQKKGGSRAIVWHATLALARIINADKKDARLAAAEALKQDAKRVAREEKERAEAEKEEAERVAEETRLRLAARDAKKAAEAEAARVAREAKESAEAKKEEAARVAQRKTERAAAVKQAAKRVAAKTAADEEIARVAEEARLRLGATEGGPLAAAWRDARVADETEPADRLAIAPCPHHAVGIVNRNPTSFADVENELRVLFVTCERQPKNVLKDMEPLVPRFKPMSNVELITLFAKWVHANITVCHDDLNATELRKVHELRKGVVGIAAIVDRPSNGTANGNFKPARIYERCVLKTLEQARRVTPHMHYSLSRELIEAPATVGTRIRRSSLEMERYVLDRGNLTSSTDGAAAASGAEANVAPPAANACKIAVASDNAARVSWFDAARNMFPAINRLLWSKPMYYKQDGYEQRRRILRMPPGQFSWAPMTGRSHDSRAGQIAGGWFEGRELVFQDSSNVKTPIVVGDGYSVFINIDARSGDVHSVHNSDRLVWKSRTATPIEIEVGRYSPRGDGVWEREFVESVDQAWHQLHGHDDTGARANCQSAADIVKAARANPKTKSKGNVELVANERTLPWETCLAIRSLLIAERTEANMFNQGHNLLFCEMLRSCAPARAVVNAPTRKVYQQQTAPSVAGKRPAPSLQPNADSGGEVIHRAPNGALASTRVDTLVGLTENQFQMLQSLARVHVESKALSRMLSEYAHLGRILSPHELKTNPRFTQAKYVLEKAADEFKPREWRALSLDTCTTLLDAYECVHKPVNKGAPAANGKARSHVLEWEWVSTTWMIACAKAVINLTNAKLTAKELVHKTCAMRCKSSTPLFGPQDYMNSFGVAEQ